jgi:beta-glucuronidase
MIKKSKFVFFFIFCVFCIFFYVSFFLNAFVKDTGIDGIVDYEKYGYFENLNTKEYKYVLSDRKGLGDSQGEGIYPNGWSIFSNPKFTETKNKGLLEGSRWAFTNIDDPALIYYKWVDCFQENPALRQFFVAEAFQKGGYIKQAIKAYYAILVFFPQETGNTYWKTPWYIGSVAVDRIYFLLNKHKEINWNFVNAELNIKNKFDNTVTNDIFSINPGKIVIKKNYTDSSVANLSKIVIPKKIDKFGNISLVKYQNDHWQLIVNNKPYLIKGIAYSPVAKGEEIKNKTFKDWSVRDANKNMKVDAPFETIVNGKVVGDFELMKDMGINTIRLYDDIANKKILNTLHDSFNIKVMIGIPLDFLRNKDLSNQKTLNSKDLQYIQNIINKHKNETYLLCWILGNEDNYYINIKQAKNFYRLVNEIAKEIKKIDKKHPIVLCNGDLLYLDNFVNECKDVDIFGANVYRGEYGLGYSFWNDLKKYWDKPIIITEYGCPSFKNINSTKDAEEKQLNYIKNSLEDINANSFASSAGVGLALGGVVFEWLDEWWKAGFPSNQDQNAQWAGPFPDGWMYEEFLGICGQGDLSNDKLTRKPKKVYYFLKKEWN